MRWAFGIRRKISAALLLATIFVLITVKSLVDSRHVAELGSSFSSVYEDRLLVESYIYRLSEHLFRKKIMFDSTGSRAVAETIVPLIEEHNAAIRQIISAYEETSLTEDEARYFEALKNNIDALLALESSFLGSFLTGEEPVAAPHLLNKEFNKAFENLGHLSRIQISEGKILNDHTKKIVAGSSLLTQFEIGILIAIGLLIMVLVFESTSVFNNSRQNESLN